MKKLLFQSSLSFLTLFLLFGVSCKTTKSKKAQQEDVVKGEEGKEEIKSDEYIIHQPGTQDQRMLDSIKAVRMKEKRGYNKK